MMIFFFFLPLFKHRDLFIYVTILLLASSLFLTRFTFHVFFFFLGTTALCIMVSTSVMVQEPIERRGLDGQRVYQTKRLHPS